MQNLIVTLASWGMNRPTPFLKGAFAVIQPLFRKRAFAVILLGFNNGDDSETRTGMCYLVGKEDILKWRAHAAHRNQKPDWQLLPTKTTSYSVKATCRSGKTSNTFHVSKIRLWFTTTSVALHGNLRMHHRHCGLEGSFLGITSPEALLEGKVEEGGL